MRPLALSCIWGKRVLITLYSVSISTHLHLFSYGGATSIVAISHSINNLIGLIITPNSHLCNHARRKRSFGCSP